LARDRLAGGRRHGKRTRILSLYLSDQGGKTQDDETAAHRGMQEYESRRPESQDRGPKG